MKKIDAFFSQKIDGSKIFGGNEGTWRDTETTITKDKKGTTETSDTYFDQNDDGKLQAGESLQICISFTPAK